jgi:tryptophan-rich sensory protein
MFLHLPNHKFWLPLANGLTTTKTADVCVPHLNMSRNLVGVLGTIIIAIYAIGSGRMVATDADWYRSLPRPAWQPPSSVFGIIWPYNFAMLIVATWLVASRLSNTSHVVWLASLALSVIAALTWARLFYGPHLLLASGFALVLATLLTLPLLVLAFRVSPVLGFAFLPYQLWLAVATSLAFGYASQ